MKILSYDSSVSYGTVYVYDPEYYIDHERPCDFEESHISQGFFAWPGMYVFFTLTDSPSLHVEVIVGERERAQFDNNTLLAIQVPLKVISKRGVIVEPLMASETVIDIPSGDYALVFEQGYQENWQQILEEEWHIPVWCRIWLTPATNVEAKILIHRSTEPGYNLSISPTYPLRIDSPPEWVVRK